MADRAALEREFRLFAAYLGASEAPARGASRYAEMQASVRAGNDDRLDRWLLAIARCGTVAASVADSYARLVRPHGLLRRKLVLTLALLESAAATHARFDRPLAAGPLRTWAALVGLGAGWALRTAAALLLLAPVHLAASIGPRGETGG